MKLTGWSLENYRSFKSCSFEPTDPSVIIGKNNSGKSNFIDSFLDYRRLILEPPETEWHEQNNYGRDDLQIEFEATFNPTNQELSLLENRILTALSYSPDQEPVFAEVISELTHRMVIGGAGVIIEEVTAPEYDTPLVQYKSGDYQILDILNEDGEDQHSISDEDPPPDHVYIQLDIDKLDDYDERLGPYHQLFFETVDNWQNVGAFRKPAPSSQFEQNRSLDADGTNLAQVLETVQRKEPDLFESLVDRYVEIMEGVTEFRMDFARSEEGGPEHTTVVVEEEGFERKFELASISSGSKELLTLLTQIVSARDDELLLIEEPELHLHPGAQNEVWELIEEVACNDGPRVILSTHSNVFVDQTSLACLFVTKRDESTELERVLPEEFDSELADLGYEQSSLIQSEKVLFVEDRSDGKILKHFAEAAGYSFGDHRITTKPMDGDGISERNEIEVEIVRRLNIPFLVVLDSDGADPEQKAATKASELELPPDQVFVWPKRSIESYLIEHPERIADLLTVDTDTVEDEFADLSDDQDAKGRLDDLFKEYCDTGYDEEGHGVVIARAMDNVHIHDDVRNLIETAAELTPR